MRQKFRLFSIIMMSLLLASVTNVYAKPVEITDLADRKVVVDVPVKKAVVAFYYQDYLAIAGDKVLDNIIGFSKAVWTDWAPSSWATFSKALPKLEKLEDVGEVEVGTFSVEKVLSLRPDLLVLAKWQYDALGSDLDALEEAKIPIVVLDYNAQTVDTHIKTTKLIGLLTGNEARAQELASYYANTVKDIQDRVKKANLPQPKVYAEFGNKGPSEYSVSFGKSMWGSMITLVGANNISKNAVEYYGPVNPELVVAAKPDAIIITGRETELKKNPEALVMGFNIPTSEAKKRLEGFAKRSGWPDLPAIKNHRLYGAYHANSRTLSDIASIQFVAKAAYPELFKDLDPTKTYLDFYKKYLPVEPQGTFYINVEGN